jgi:hypothetical protein
LNGCAENIVSELSLLHLAVLVFGAWDAEKEQLPSSFLFLCDKFFHFIGALSGPIFRFQ